jgi:hypothetical protein
MQLANFFKTFKGLCKLTQSDNCFLSSTIIEIKSDAETSEHKTPFFTSLGAARHEVQADKQKCSVQFICARISIIDHLLASQADMKAL